MKSLENFTQNEVVNADEVKGGTFGFFSYFNCWPKITYTCQPKPNNCYTPPTNCYTPPQNNCYTPPSCKPKASGTISAQ